MEVHLPIFRGSCSNFELMRILLIIWIAVLQCFVINSRPLMKAVVGTCFYAISLDHLDFRLLCLAHIVEIMMNSLSVLFRDGSFSSYLSRKLFEFRVMRIPLIIWIAVMVRWQYFKMFFFISGSKFLSLSMKAFVRTCPCANSLDHLDFRLFMVGSHS